MCRFTADCVTVDRRPETEENESRCPTAIPAIRVSLLPKDTNAFGTIFGGVIPSNIDGERVKVTEAEVVLVAVNEHGRPVPIRPEVPPA